MKQNHATKTALVTGASSGIGLALIRRLLSEGMEVIALNRSDLQETDDTIREAIKQRRLRIYRADLANFAELRSALKEIVSRETRIDLLFNNAGGSFPKLMYSPQGRELSFELHTVVPYIMIKKLRPLLLAAGRSVVVHTSSSAIHRVRDFAPSLLEQPEKFRKLFGPYAWSKLALSLWTRELAPTLAAEGIVMTSADPGGNNTLRKDNASGLPLIVRLIMKLLFPPPTHGAELLNLAATETGRGSVRPGAFVVKGREAKLPYTEFGRDVLAKVEAIYMKEFAAEI